MEIFCDVNVGSKQVAGLRYHRGHDDNQRSGSFICGISARSDWAFKLHLEVEKFRGRGRALLAPENGSAPAVPGVKLHICAVSKVVIPHRPRLDTLAHSKGAGKI